MTTTLTTELFIPASKLAEVSALLRESKTKHWPFRRDWQVYPGYWVKIADGPLSSYLALKYSK